jgi:hypothetical protein
MTPHRYKVASLLASNGVGVCDLGEDVVDAAVYKRIAGDVKKDRGEGGAYAVFLISGGEGGGAYI